MLVWSNEAQDGVLVAEVETLDETYTTRSSRRRREREVECNFMPMFIPVVEFKSMCDFFGRCCLLACTCLLSRAIWPKKGSFTSNS